MFHRARGTVSRESTVLPEQCAPEAWFLWPHIGRIATLGHGFLVRGPPLSCSGFWLLFHSGKKGMLYFPFSRIEKGRVCECVCVEPPAVEEKHIFVIYEQFWMVA